MVNYNLPVVFEWPRHNLLWKIPKVHRTLRRLGCEMCLFDGCQFGLRPARRGFQKHYLKKPWAFATNVPDIAHAFSVLCTGITGTHQHDITCGINSKRSQYYTPLMAATIHVAFDYFFNPGVVAKGVLTGSYLIEKSLG